VNPRYAFQFMNRWFYDSVGFGGHAPPARSLSFVVIATSFSTPTSPAFVVRFLKTH